MNLSAFDFPFDPTLVASTPTDPRDHARLLVVERRTERMAHHRVADLPDLLQAGDVVVANDTKVLPARLMGRKLDTGGQVAILFVRPVDEAVWEVMLKGPVRIGQRFELASDAVATVIQHADRQTVVRVDCPRPFRAVMEAVGQMPLPPYIKRAPSAEDRKWYQTTFAREEGAIAAPTAGLHLTDSLRVRLGQRGIGWASITLHVGPGTFKPVTVSHIAEHQMEPERFCVSKQATEAVQRTRGEGGRVAAVGTTVVRTLESSVNDQGMIVPGAGETALYVTPGYRFRVVDVLLTNFHFPRTTLLMLVSAFGGLELMREAYRLAVRERYRFYSYGDAMLIL